MKIKTLFLSLSFLFILFPLIAQEQLQVKVKNEEQLKDAIKNAQPGTEVIMANGTWEDIQIVFKGEGTEDRPIFLKAETPGKVKLEGRSSLKLGGNYLVVEGLYFTNGYTPSDAVIEFRIDDDHLANHSRVTNCVIENFTQPDRSISDLWVLFWGRHNKFDHSYLAGKFNEGPTLRVALKGNENIKNYHQIVNNHFGPRPRKGGPKAETIQIGSSETSMAPSYVSVANNFFEECNGEIEVISNKSSFNEFRNNVFYKSEGSLVLRHGNYCVVDGNIFIGDGKSPYFGGIRVINTGHLITNNYFYNLKGDEFRSPLAIMNGIPKSPLNRYNQVTDVVVAHNTWVDCPTPWHISVGANMDKEDVLPPQEIRSARPKRVIVANNLVYNSKPDEPLIQAYDEIDGMDFRNNVVNSNVKLNETREGISVEDIKLKKIGEFLYVPSENQEILSNPFHGFEFDLIEEDVFGEYREKGNLIGAFSRTDYKSKNLVEKKEYGPDWFKKADPKAKSKIIKITSKDKNLIHQKIASANDGDVIELGSGNFSLNRSLVIDKEITITSGDPSKKAKISFSGSGDSPAFKLGSKGYLTLKNIVLTGSGNDIAFSTLKDSMFYGYNLRIENSEVQNFGTILKAYKQSFADSIFISNSSFSNADQGILLAAETDDKGDYNAEFVNIHNSEFKNIKENVINFYRGGYDESTIGGNLKITGSSFTGCGENEETGILIKTRGIVNVEISHNTFYNNPVEVIALLWGEKGNVHKNNEIKNSGKFVIEKYLKQKLMY